MGTDIHAYLEYPPGPGGFTGDLEQPAWLYAGYVIARDYDLFDALGDGHSSQLDPADAARKGLIPPRGVPADLSIGAGHDYFDLIPGSDRPHWSFWPEHACVSEAEARRRLESGACHGASVFQRYRSPERSWRAVSRPGLHTPSWLYLDEIKQALRHFGRSDDALEWGFRVLLGTMTLLEAELGSERVRLVFWFDN